MTKDNIGDEFGRITKWMSLLGCVNEHTSGFMSESMSRTLTLLTESQESKSQSEAIQLAMSRAGMSKAQAEQFVRTELRSKFEVLHGNHKAGKFTLGLTRMMIDGLVRDEGSISKINKIIPHLLTDGNYNNYDRNLNGLGWEELIDAFDDTLSAASKREREEVGAMSYGEPTAQYSIIPINTHEEAAKYAPYCTWCITQNPSPFSNYSGNGINQFYFCLRDGFENEPKNVGENSPLDSYGLSMIAISVGPDGDLNTCTCRWNHNNGGNDHVMNAKQISQVIGRNFYDTFKPNTKWNDEIKEVEASLAQGFPLDRIFDRHEQCTGTDKNLAIVYLNGMANIVADGERLLLDKWLGCISSCFSEGYAVARTRSETPCYVGEDGRTVQFNQLFKQRAASRAQRLANGESLDDVFPLRNECYSLHGWIVKLDGKYNAVKDGNLLSDEWYDSITSLSSSEMRVRKGHKINIMRFDGTLLSPNAWFDRIYMYTRGWGINYAFTVVANGKIMRMDKEGNITSTADVVKDLEFSEGFAPVRLGQSAMNYVREDGTLLLEEDYDTCEPFANGYGCVSDGEEYCDLVDKNGHMFFSDNNEELGLSGDSVECVGDGLFKVWYREVCDNEEDGEHEEYTCQLIDSKGKELSSIYDEIKPLCNGFMRVSRGYQKWNYIDAKGQLLHKKFWFRAARDFNDGYGKVLAPVPGTFKTAPFSGLYPNYANGNRAIQYAWAIIGADGIIRSDDGQPLYQDEIQRQSNESRAMPSMRDIVSECAIRMGIRRKRN